MTVSRFNRLRAVATGMTLGAALSCAQQAALADEAARSATATPIKHVIIIVGENHTFDNLFGTYRPRAGQQDRQPPEQGDRQ